MASEREPVEVFSLASYLAEEMEERDWTSGDIALRMGGDYPLDCLTVELLLSCGTEENVIIAPETYRALEAAFGVSDGFFERLNRGWLEYPDKRVPFEAPDILFGPPNHARP